MWVQNFLDSLKQRLLEIGNVLEMLLKAIYKLPEGPKSIKNLLKLSKSCKN